MINKTKIDNISLMLEFVRNLILQDPIGRINNSTGKTKPNGAQHTIDINDVTFSPLLDTVFKIAPFKFNIVDVWTNVTYPNGKNNKHIHIGADIAGCFYLYVPENSGDIEFETGERFLPKAGEIYWWDANITHWVHENKSNDIRISIAFNIEKIKE